MFQTILDFIISILPAIASTAVLTLCGVGYKWIRGFHKEHTALVSHLKESDGLKADVEEIKALQEPQNAALREILGRLLNEEHARLVKQGYASPAEKKAFEKIYTAYHGLGGNGTRTALYKDVMKMKAYKTG